MVSGWLLVVSGEAARTKGGFPHERLHQAEGLVVVVSGSVEAWLVLNPNNQQRSNQQRSN